MEETIHLQSQAAAFLNHLDNAFRRTEFSLDKQQDLLTDMLNKCEEADVDSIFSNRYVAEGLAMRLHDVKMAGDAVWHQGTDCHGNDGLFEDFEQSIGE